MNDQETGSASQLPGGGQHVLYRHWSKDGRLLYAGRTNNPPARLRQHRTEATWWALVSWTTYESFPSLEALKAGELWAIKNENPECNKQGREYPAQPRQSPEPGTDRYPPVTNNDMHPEVRLVHPLSREFSVYGGDDTVLRARKWALAHQYYLLGGSSPLCAHALYRMHCPNTGRCFPRADHTQVWIPAPDFSRFEIRSTAAPPFILTQPYYDSLGLDYPGDEIRSWPESRSDIPAETASYAAAHGLDAESFSSDAWYYPGNCMPIRLTSSTRHTQWPLEAETLRLMCAWRDEWPETVPEWLT